MQTLAVYNLKGGVGKTAAAVNLAWHAARWKYRTLVWDLDPQGAASFCLGVDGACQYQPGSLLAGKRQLGSLVCKTRWPNLTAIPADPALRNFDIKLVEAGGGKTRLRKLLSTLRDDVDLVILDCPPTLSPVAESIFAAADVLLVPVIPTHFSVRAFEQVRETLATRQPNLKVVPFFNMVDGRRMLHMEMVVKPPKVMKDMLKTWIPYSTHVEQMGEYRAPIGDFAGHTPAPRAFRHLWFELAERLGL